LFLTNTGRKGVELLVKSVNEVLNGKIQTKAYFATNLAHNLAQVANDSVKLTTKFVPDEIVAQPAKILSKL
jgi:hypothetical protein